MSSRQDSFEKYALEVILGRRNDWRARLLRLLLAALSVVFRGLVQTRLAAYRHRILREANLGTMVISIGNLTVGGTGKTPVVEMFARALAQGGRQVAILSRGYKSRKPPLGKRLAARLRGARHALPPRVVSDGQQLQLDVRNAGDEPWMLARNLIPARVAVVVDRDRVHCGLHALEAFNADTLILDDGLQYLKLRHRLDIVLIDATEPFGNGRLLPRGTLREPPANLRRASYIFLTKCDGSPQDQLIAEIRRHNRTAQIIHCTHQPQYLEDLITGERFPLEKLQSKRVAALSGIAQPRSFERGLENLGATIEIRQRFSDHHFFKEREISNFLERAIHRDVHYVLTTEKDAVRFPKIEHPDLPIYFLRIEIKILDGFASWEECVQRICAPHYQLPARYHFDHSA